MRCAYIFALALLCVCGLAVPITVATIHAAPGEGDYVTPETLAMELTIGGSLSPVMQRFELFKLGNKTRLEGLDDHPVAIIMSPDEQKLYMLSLKNKIFVEHPYRPGFAAMHGVATAGVTWVKKGSEVVNGEPCTSYLATGIPANSGKPEPTVTLLVSDKTKLPFQTRTETVLPNGTQATSFCNFKPLDKRPDEAMFRIPADFKPTEAPRPLKTR
ncbi:hypothetical protein DB346_24550 [Verrucomicrobia bacterium LW23]|nr:hypothetical protein DB346_24550 [Verrucomicrobia bacterium LW23]